MDDVTTNANDGHEERPIPDDLEHNGMGYPCIECGNATSWLPCWSCFGEGGWDGEQLMEEDPLWYDADDYRRCDECRGNGGWDYCIQCRKIVKVNKTQESDDPGICSLGYDMNT